jgi:hypothetical protein
MSRSSATSWCAAAGRYGVDVDGQEYPVVYDEYQITGKVCVQPPPVDLE